MHEHQKDLEYIPGSCNIGAEEIARRYRVGYIGLALSILLILIIEGLDFHKFYRLSLCVPIALSLTGFVQATQRFCFAYGIRGVFSVKGMRDLTSVANAEYLRQDRNMALGIIAKVVFGSILITAIYFLLP